MTLFSDIYLAKPLYNDNKRHKLTLEKLERGKKLMLKEW